MFDVGMPELIVIFIVALLVFGPKRLPELGKSIGKGLAELKKSLQDVKEQVETEFKEATSDIKEAVEAEKGSLKKELEELKGSLKDVKGQAETKFKEVSSIAQQQAADINEKFEDKEKEEKKEEKEKET